MRIAYGNAFSTEDRSPASGRECGSIAVPLLLLTVVLVAAILFTLGYATFWRSKAEVQLRLDRCAEGAALALVRIQNTIESSNLRLRAERAAAAATAVPTYGASIEAAQPALEAEVAIQEAERAEWRIRQARWLAARGCDGRGDLFLPLPNLKWSRPPPDTIGAQPLDWEGSDTRLLIRLWRTNRFTQARVNRSGDDLANRWKAEWVARDAR